MQQLTAHLLVCVMAEGELQQLLVRGNSIASRLAVDTSSQAVAETEAFATLKLLRRLLRASHSCVASALSELLSTSSPAVWLVGWSEPEYCCCSLACI